MLARYPILRVVLPVLAVGFAAGAFAEELKPSKLPPLVGSHVFPVVVPAAARIAEIQAWLGDAPVGPGRPVADRTAWRALAARVPEKEILAEAERIAAQPVPPLADELYLLYTRTGSRDEFQRASGVRLSRLSLLAWAEGLEARGRFGPALARYLDAILAEKTWTLPAHDPRLDNFEGRVVEVDLGVAMTAWSLATVDYWLGDRLPADTRAHLRAEIHRRAIAPYLAGVRGTQRRTTGWWWITGTNNWNAVCHAGVAGAALALGGPAAERAEVLAATEANLPFFLDQGIPADGYCDEGVGYWNYGIGHAALLAETVAQATGGHLRLFAGEKARHIAEFPANLEITPGVFPAFSDGAPDVKPSPFYRALTARLVDEKAPFPAAQATLALFRGSQLYQTAYEVFWPGETQRSTSRAAASLPLLHWFGDAQVLVSRAGPGFGAAIKGSHNGESHNHNDIGSFVIAAGSATPIVDPGGEVYTARTFSPRRYESKVLNSYGHSVPVVAGQLQGAGRGFAARVVRTEFTERADRVVFDLRGGYAVPSLRSLERDFTLTRGAQPAVTVTDTVEFASPQGFGTALITFGPWHEETPGVLVVGEGAGAVRVEYSATGGELRLRAETLDENMPEHRKALRLGLDFAAPVTRASITTRISPVASGK